MNQAAEQKKLSKKVSLITFVSFTAFALLFYGRYILDFNGYPGFGNFFIPLDKSSLDWQIVWNPFAYNGAISITPITSALSIAVYNVPLYILASIFPMFLAGKVYIVLSFIVLSSSFFYFTKVFSNNYLIRITSTFFYLLLPINLMILSAGDPNSLFFLSFTFLSYRFLWGSITRSEKIVGKNAILSTIFLALSIGDYEVFLLGILLFILLFIYFSFSNEPVNIKNLFNMGRRLLILILLLLLLIFPEIYIIIAEGSTKTFIFNPGLGSFIGNSVSFFNVLILKGYPPNLAWISVSTIGLVLINNVWEVFEIFLLLLLVVSPIIERNKKLLFFSALIVLGALLGSGAKSPISFLNTYLYLHFPGYESLNGSYFWDWIFLSFLFTVLFINLLEFLHNGNVFKMRRLSHSNSRYIKTFFVLLTIFVVATPVLTQGYYGNDGINNTWGKSMPAYFPQLQKDLTGLVNNSYAGIAYFNPDMNLYIGNKSDNFINPLILFQPGRTAMLHYYASPQYTQNRFFFYVYRLFYLNETNELAELMGMAGIQYFVYLKNLNSFSYNGSWMPWSENANVTNLMSYQRGVSAIINNSNYTIYKNNDYFAPAVSSANLTILTGGLPELNSIFIDGFNLTESSIVNVNSLNTNNFVYILNHTKQIFLSDTNAMAGIILANSTRLSPSGNSLNSNPYDGWASSFSISENGPIFLDTLTPFFVTFTHSKMTVALNRTQSSSTIWLHVYLTDNPAYGNHGIYINTTSGYSFFINTSSYAGMTNKFVWIRIPLNESANEIQITSIGSINAIKELYDVPTGFVSSGLRNLYSYLYFNGIKLYLVDSAYTLCPISTSKNDHLQNYSISTGNAPYGGVYLTSQETGYSSELQLQIPNETGMLYFEVASTDGGIININSSSNLRAFGYSTQRLVSPNNYSIVGLPWSRQMGQHITIHVSGLVFFQAFIFIPSFTTHLSTYLINYTSNVAYNTYLPDPTIITNTTLRIGERTNSYSFKGTFYVHNASNGNALINYVTNLPFLYDYSLMVNFSATPGIIININSLRLPGTNNQSSIFVSSPLFGYLDRLNNKDTFLNISATHELVNVDVSFNITLFFRYELPFWSSTANINGLTFSIHNFQYGYILEGPFSSIIAVRLPYYSLFHINESGAILLPGLGGVNEIVISENPIQKIAFIVNFYNAIFYSFVLDVFVVASFAIYSFIRERKVKQPR